MVLLRPVMYHASHRKQEEQKQQQQEEEDRSQHHKVLYTGPEKPASAHVVIKDPVYEEKMTWVKEAEDFVFLLIQDWLKSSNLKATSACLIDECMKLKKTCPTSDRWYAMMNEYALKSFSEDFQPVQGNNKTKHTTRPTAPILHLLLAMAFKERRKILQEERQMTPSILVSKRPQSTSNRLKFSAKKDLPPSSSSKAVEGKSLRPKSAAVCKSTSDLLLRTTTSQSNLEAPSTQKTQKISPEKDRNSTDNTKKYIDQKVCNEETSILTKPVVKAIQMNHNELKDSTPTTNKDMNVIHDMQTMKTEKEQMEVYELMNETQLSSQYNALSRVDVRKVHRLLVRSNAVEIQLTKTKKTMDKINSRNQERNEKFALKELLGTKSSYMSDSMIKSYENLYLQPCGLCEQLYLKKNLKMSVSYKSIYDLRCSWAMKEGHKPLDQDMLEQAKRAEIAHYYDEVPICVFCTQLLTDFSNYRVSSVSLFLELLLINSLIYV
jgi:hypothetical protein